MLQSITLSILVIKPRTVISYLHLDGYRPQQLQTKVNRKEPDLSHRVEPENILNYS